jgi:hypothetical protein
MFPKIHGAIAVANFQDCRPKFLSAAGNLTARIDLSAVINCNRANRLSEPVVGSLPS